MEPLRRSLPLGVASIVFANCLISLGDALVKAESGFLSLWQIFAGRGLVALPLLTLLLLLRGGTAALRPQRPGWVTLRSLLLLAMWGFYYSALPFLELSLAAVALYTAPLFIAVISSRVAGRAVGARRWLAILLGFLGVVISLRPEGSVDWAVLLPVLGALCYAGAMVITAERCAGESPIALSFYLNLALFLCGLLALALLQILPGGAGLPFLLSPDWRIPAEAWPLLVLLGLLIVVFSVAVALAYQLAPTPLVGLFGYSYLPFAALWSALLLGEVPSAANLLGLAVIALAGGLALRPGAAPSSHPGGRGSRRRWWRLPAP